MQNTIEFEMADWVEIVETLGPEDRPGQDKKWIGHLRRIIRKIEGPKCEGVNFAVFTKPVTTKKGGR